MSLVRFNPDGSLLFIYEDEHPCLDLGRALTQRASHVEPTEDGMWQADMGPIGGPKLNKTVAREASLLSEMIWIRTKVLS